MGIGRWTINAIDAGWSAASEVQHAADLGRHVRNGVGRARWASEGLEDVRRSAGGRYAGVPVLLSGGVVIGNGLYHGDGDRKVALEMLDLGFADLERELADAITSAPPSEKNSATAQWWTIHVAPAIAEWRSFAANERASWIARVATKWETFETWRDRLVRLRENARIQGIALASPEPISLPKTITERGHAGAGSPFQTLWTFVKVVLYAAIGVTGFIGLYRVAQDWRAGNDASRQLPPEGTTTT